ncbi:MAG: hypothetical protein MR388_05410 [Tenericutes bacterium]|nr:hypothetical protein [Mycoplasmatota bacterium]
MKRLETATVIVNYSQLLEQLAISTLELLNNKMNEYVQLFDIEKIDSITVNYFDDLEEFREFIYQLCGENSSLPEYARGTYDNGMINVCIDPKRQMNRIYTSSHELFHILYMKYILKDNYDNRIVWYDEGMAQYFSGEKQKLDQEQLFIDFYIKVKENTKIIPNMNEITHGKSFYNDSYNGYDLSYLSIKYLSEIMSLEGFKKLMSDFNQIKMLGDSVVDDMFDYFDKKFIYEKTK